MVNYPFANITIPETPNVIERPRLLRRLADIQPGQIGLITAPAGYGKTTLVAQFARQAQYPVAWHTIEVHERDIQNLHAHSLRALEGIQPGISTTFQPGENTPISLATNLASTLSAKLKKPAYYILDDLQHLIGAPAAESWLQTFLQRIPDHCLPILVSRKLLTLLPIVELLAHNQIITLNQADLRLTDSEASQYIDQTLEETLSASQQRAILEQLDGWPAGTALAVNPLSIDIRYELPAADSTPEALFRALAMATLQHLPSDLRHFLLVSATLQRLTPERCQSILQMTGSGELLEAVHKRNLFLSKDITGYSYHPLFRSLLQEQLQQDQPDVFTDLHLRAAQWFEDNNQVEQAFDHYMAAGQKQEAIIIAERLAVAYYNEGRNETLLYWFNRLNEVDAEAPQLAYHCTLIYTDRYAYEEAKLALDRAEAVYIKSGEAQRLEEIILHRGWIDVITGQHQTAIERLEPLCSSSFVTVKARALRLRGLAYVHTGKLDIGIDLLHEALPLLQSAGHIQALSALLDSLFVAHTRQGDLSEAGTYLQESVRIQRKLGNAGNLASVLNDLGYHYHLCGHYSEAKLSFEEGLGLVANAPESRVEGYLLWSYGDLLRDVGSYAQAQALYERALEIAGHDTEPRMRSGLLLSLATLRRWQGQPARALLLAQEVEDLAAVHDLSIETALTRLNKHSAQLALNNRQEAFDNLSMLYDEVEQQGIIIEVASLPVLCAQASLLIGEEERALRYLDTSLNISREMGTAQPLAVELARHPECLEFVNSLPHLHPLQEAVENLRIAQADLGQLPAPPVEMEPSQTYSLRIRTLGRISVKRDGQPVPPSEWEAQGARELFFYLLFHGPQSRDHLVDLFWPESDPDKAKNLFWVTTHRARQAVGKNVVLHEQGRYQINMDIDIWCDALELEKLADSAQHVPPHDIYAQETWRKVVDLYRGDFLVTLDYPWVIAWREKLEKQYLAALKGLAHNAFSQDNHSEAVVLYQKSIEVAPYQETVHRHLMQCYAAQGKRYKILEHFNQLKQMLMEELGLEPEPATREEVARLTGLN